MATTCSTPPVSRALPDLAAIRRARDLSLKQISEATKIRTHYLDAIENLRFDQLPGGVFATSYIRQYARAIDFDEWELLAAYDSTQPHDEVEAPRASFSWASALRLTVSRILAPARRA
jgi:cytoskeletal protein RodZ